MVCIHMRMGYQICPFIALQGFAAGERALCMLPRSVVLFDCLVGAITVQWSTWLNITQTCFLNASLANPAAA